MRYKVFINISYEKSQYTYGTCGEESKILGDRLFGQSEMCRFNDIATCKINKQRYHYIYSCYAEQCLEGAACKGNGKYRDSIQQYQSDYHDKEYPYHIVDAIHQVVHFNTA